MAALAALVLLPWGPQEAAAEIDPVLAAVVDRHFGKEPQPRRDEIGRRLQEALQPLRNRPDKLPRALRAVEGLIRSVLGVTEFQEKWLARHAPPVEGATRTLPRELYVEEQELAVALVERAVADWAAAPPPGPRDLEALRVQLDELVGEWKAATAGLCTGRHAAALLDALEERRRGFLQGFLEDPFLGLTRPLEPSEMRQMKDHLRAEAAAARDSIDVDDSRVLRVLLGEKPLDEELESAAWDKVRRATEVLDRMGNALQRVHYTQHPRVAEILVRQKEHLRRVKEAVDEIRKREGTRADPRYRFPEAGRTPRDGEPPHRRPPEAGSGAENAPAPARPGPASSPAPDRSPLNTGRGIPLTVFAAGALLLLVLTALVRRRGGKRAG